MEGYHRKLAALFVVAALLWGTVGWSTAGHSVAAPIGMSVHVDGDDALLELKTTLNLTGNGTAGDPIIFSNMTFDAAGGPSSIYLGNITLHILFRDCLVINATDVGDRNGTGIFAYNCTSLRIVGCAIWDNVGTGIAVIGCGDFRLENSSIIGHRTGVLLNDTAGTTYVMNNTIERNGVGVEVIGSNCTIAWNDMIDNRGFGVVLNITSNNNTLHRNAFSGNNLSNVTYDPQRAQARDDGDNNRWNMSAGPGNWWSDLTSPVSGYYVTSPYLVNGTANSTDPKALAQRPKVPGNMTMFETDREPGTAIARWVAPIGTTVNGPYLYEVQVRNGSVTVSRWTEETSWAEIGLENGHNYSLRVRAWNPKGPGNFTAWTNVMPIDVPSAPQNFTANCTSKTIHLAWEAPSYDGGAAVDKYVVKLDGSINNFTTQLQFNITGLVNGRTYTVSVQAHNPEGWSVSTPTLTVVPTSVPSAPRNVSYISSYTSISIIWTEPVDTGGLPLTGYQLTRYASSNETLVIDLDGKSYIDTNVTLGKPYRYEVRANNSVGLGPSNSISGVYLKSPAIYGRVVNSTGSGIEGIIVRSDNGHQTLTDGDGNYVLDLMPGSYKVTFIAAGYQSQTVQVEVGLGPLILNDVTMRPVEQSSGQDMLWIYVLSASAAVIIAILAFVLWRRR